jgi:hypothetical protein
MAMTRRKRTQLIAALLIAPLVIALPSLWPRLDQPGFALRNADVLLIFVVLPYAAALWLYLGKVRRP